jgi:hypothetical protein
VLCVQYVKWANQTDLDAFWTDPKVKRLFKNHIYAMTSRVNVYNGVLRTPGSPAAPIRILIPSHNKMLRCLPRCMADNDQLYTAYMR